MFIWMLYLCNFWSFIFTSRSVPLPIRFGIPRESFLISPSSSTLYALLGGIGATLASGFFDDAALAIVDRGLTGARGGAGGFDVEDFMRPEIKWRQYLLSRAKCAHICRVFRDYLMTNRWQTVDNLRYSRSTTDNHRQLNNCLPWFDREPFIPLTPTHQSSQKPSRHLFFNNATPPSFGQTRPPITLRNNSSHFSFFSLQYILTSVDFSFT